MNYLGPLADNILRDGMVIYLRFALPLLFLVANCFHVHAELDTVKELVCQPNPAYAEGLICGRNSFYLFLMFIGRSEVELESMKNIPITQEGSSLLDISKAATAFSVDTKVRRYDVADAVRMPLPAILHLVAGSNSLTPYHFSVAYKRDAKQLYFVSGVSGEQYSIEFSKLPRVWTGFALVPKHNSTAEGGVRAIMKAGLVGVSIINVFVIGHVLFRLKQ